MEAVQISSKGQSAGLLLQQKAQQYGCNLPISGIVRYMMCLQWADRTLASCGRSGKKACPSSLLPTAGPPAGASSKVSAPGAASTLPRMAARLGVTTEERLATVLERRAASPT